MKDREAYIQAILAGPDYMDCPWSLGARIRIEDCVKRQTVGIRHRNGIGYGAIPLECRDCEVGKRALQEWKKGGGSVGKEAVRRKPRVREEKPKYPDFSKKAFSTFFTDGSVKEKAVFVNFDGQENLYDRFCAEAKSARQTPGEHLLWLVGVYVEGLEAA